MANESVHGRTVRIGLRVSLTHGLVKNAGGGITAIWSPGVQRPDQKNALSNVRMVRRFSHE
jgi:hypothetical protein